MGVTPAGGTFGSFHGGREDHSEGEGVQTEDIQRLKEKSENIWIWKHKNHQNPQNWKNSGPKPLWNGTPRTSRVNQVVEPPKEKTWKNSQVSRPTSKTQHKTTEKNIKKHQNTTTKHHSSPAFSTHPPSNERATLRYAAQALDQLRGLGSDAMDDFALSALQLGLVWTVRGVRPGVVFFFCFKKVVWGVKRCGFILNMLAVHVFFLGGSMYS